MKRRDFIKTTLAFTIAAYTNPFSLLKAEGGIVKQPIELLDDNSEFWVDCRIMDNKSHNGVNGFHFRMSVNDSPIINVGDIISFSYKQQELMNARVVSIRQLKQVNKRIYNK